MTSEELERKATAERRKYIVNMVEQLIHLGRDTYFRKDLSAEELASHSNAEILGQMVAETLRWEPNDILAATYAAFEDANMHGLNRQFQGFLNGEFWLLNKEKLKKISLHDLIKDKTDLFK